MSTNARFLGLILSVITVCSSAGEEPPLVSTFRHSRIELSSFLGSLGPVLAPARVEALPVKVLGDGPRDVILVEEQPVVLAPSVGATLARTLLNVDSYVDGITICSFNPAVVFRFRQGTSAVQALVCFSCNELVFEVPGAQSLSGKMRFGKGRSVLLAEAKRAFPENRELQALKE